MYYTSCICSYLQYNTRYYLHTYKKKNIHGYYMQAHRALATKEGRGDQVNFEY